MGLYRDMLFTKGKNRTESLHNAIKQRRELHNNIIYQLENINNGASIFSMGREWIKTSSSWRRLDGRLYSSEELLSTLGVKKIEELINGWT